MGISRPKDMSKKAFRFKSKSDYVYQSISTVHKRDGPGHGVHVTAENDVF